MADPEKPDGKAALRQRRQKRLADALKRNISKRKNQKKNRQFSTSDQKPSNNI